MNKSWEDLLRRVYYAGYDDRQRERDYDPMDHKIVDTARIRAEKLEQRIRDLESSLKRLLWLHNDDRHGTTPVASEAEWDEAWEAAAELVKEPTR